MNKLQTCSPNMTWSSSMKQRGQIILFKLKVTTLYFKFGIERVFNTVFNDNRCGKVAEQCKCMLSLGFRFSINLVNWLPGTWKKKLSEWWSERGDRKRHGMGALIDPFLYLYRNNIVLLDIPEQEWMNEWMQTCIAHNYSACIRWLGKNNNRMMDIAENSHCNPS